MKIDRRFYSVAILGCASAMPLALLSSGLTAWFSYFHLSLMHIGLFSLLTLPYALKFLWAPFLEFSIFPFLDRRLSWILITQVGLSALFFLLAFTDPRHHLAEIGVICFFVSLCSATQDIVIDAQRADILTPEERGLGASVYLASYRIGLLISGGLGWVVADHLGWSAYFFMLSALYLLLTMNNFFLPTCSHEMIFHQKSDLLKPVMELLNRPKILLILIFILFYKIGDALGMSLITNFFMTHLKISLTELGVAYKTMGILSTLFGAFLGGSILIRYDLFPSLLVFGFVQALGLLLFAWMAAVPLPHYFYLWAVFIESFSGGMSSAAFMALLVAWCHVDYTATQYALFSAMASLGRVFLGPVAAAMVLKMGWAWFFVSASVLCLPSLLLLLWIRGRKLLPNH